ncbi:hypothetical protein [Lysobacter sp. CA196]|uniref:hypothetical protein n=1 Tax=Lysobacter sp. CA196 TaxID=3455606 RepID=UPI003F8CFEBE
MRFLSPATCAESLRSDARREAAIFAVGIYRSFMPGAATASANFLVYARKPVHRLSASPHRLALDDRSRRMHRVFIGA